MKTARTAVVFVMMLFLLLSLAGCGEKEHAPAKPARTPEMQQPGDTVPEVQAEPDVQEGTDPEEDMNGCVKGKELYKLLETEEEALAVAKIYGIEFVGLEFGVATFHTEEDPFEVVKRGKENGWPEIAINFYKQAH